ncbi:hypothetical protein [Streptomyces albidoflavus]|uniref:hypothetical protein n=1 Tax=Streptomyces albidoflavus TaxID=1886 RepID=UPI0033C7A039
MPNDPKAKAEEISKAYRERIRIMSTYGEDSPEGLVAEEIADQKAFAFRDQFGRSWQSYLA